MMLPYEGYHLTIRVRNLTNTRKALRSVDLKAFCGAYEIRTRDLLRDRQAF